MKTKLILTALSLVQACILIVPGNASAQSPAPSSIKKPNIVIIWGDDVGQSDTRAVVAHMFKNYDGVLKVDGEVGNKKVYDPRSYLALAEAAMAERVKQAVNDLRGNGKTMFAS